MSFAGKEIAFSCFERSQSKAKLSSVSMRHGFQTNFVTFAPLEQDDLSTLKLSIIRENKVYNNHDITTNKKKDSISKDDNVKTNDEQLKQEKEEKQ